MGIFMYEYLRTLCKHDSLYLSRNSWNKHIIIRNNSKSRTRRQNQDPSHNRTQGIRPTITIHQIIPGPMSLLHQSLSLTRLSSLHRRHLTRGRPQEILVRPFPP